MAKRGAWGVDDIMKEISDTAKLLETRRTLNLAAPCESAMAETIVYKINHLDYWSTSSATALLESAACLPDGIKTIVCEAIDKKLLSTPTEDDSVAKACSLLHLHNYFTESMWQTWYDPDTSVLSKMYLLISLEKRLGATTICQQTVKWNIALILASLKALPTYHQIYDMVVDFRKLWHSDGTVVTAAPHLARYPVHPSKDNLPKGVWEAVYGSSNSKPDPRLPEHLNALAHHHTPLRPTSRLLLNEKKSQTPAAGPSTGTLSDLVTILKELRQADTSSEKPPSLPPRVIPSPARSPTSLPSSWTGLSIADQPHADAPATGAELREASETAAPHTLVPGASASIPGAETFKPKLREPFASDAPKVDSEVYEDAAFQKLTGRSSVMKRPAANAGAKGVSKATSKAPAPTRAKLGRSLGCSKCRWSRYGCGQCKNPSYKPRPQK